MTPYLRAVRSFRLEEIVPLLLTVDWLVGRARAMTNVVSDILVALLPDKTERGGASNSAAV